MLPAQEERVYQKNDIIFHEHERPDGVYIVKDGLVQLFQTLHGEKGPIELELGRVGARGMFGEMGLIDHHPRSASARALGPTTVVFIAKEMYLQHLDQLPPWVSILLKTFVRRLRDSNKKLTELLESFPDAGSLEGHEFIVASGEEHEKDGEELLKNMGG